MASGKYSFTIEQGATTKFEIVYTDSENNPVDLTGHQARMQLRPSIGSDEVYITLSSSLDPDGTGLNLSGSNGDKPPTSGSIGICISANSSSQFEFREAYYDLEIAVGDPYPVVTRILEGRVKISPNVTLGPY